ncbi:MAG: response regulator [Gammaproteobacteria bacterium]|nr:response regulator [Gammaproteobacteria bacterium]
MRFLVADDHPLVKAGLKQLLITECPDAQLDEAANGAEVIAVLEAADPAFDLILLDYYMPGSEDGRLIALLKDRFPQLSILVLSACMEPDVIERCLALGASGYVTKQTAHEAVIAAIRHILAGGTYKPPELLLSRFDSSSAEDNAPEGTTEDPRYKMTKRQRDVLALLAHGDSNKTISRKLSLSENTVKSHVTSILRVLGVSSRMQAVLVAQQLGIDHVPSQQ